MAEAEMALAQRCGSLLERLRWLECDAVGFGSRIAQTHPKQWAAMGDDWPSLFADYPILVEVRVKNLIWGRIWSDDGQGG